jgi:putative flippase GtrA
VSPRLPALPARWVKVWRYTVGSVIAAVTSLVVFAVAYGLGLGNVPANVLAFVAGAVPNWVLNRTWAWQRRGRVHVRREIILYAIVSALSLAASSAATGWADVQVPAVTANRTLQVLLVACAYIATYGILFVAKYAVYELVIFAGADRSRRSRHQVVTTTRPNRAP